VQYRFPPYSPTQCTGWSKGITPAALGKRSPIAFRSSNQLRQLPENRDQTDNQLLSKVSGQVITILCPEPGASFSVGSERLSEGEFRTKSKDEPKVARNWEI
jgi:hypothetical protein